MASKNENNANLGGGAMLSSDNKALPSLNETNQIKNRASNQSMSSLSGNNQSETPQRGSEDELTEEDQKKLSNGPEKQVAKMAAEKALEAYGVPEPIAKGAVEKADEKGVIDRVVDDFKKNRTKRIISAVASAVVPLLMAVLQFLLIAGVINMISKGVMSVADNVKKYFGADNLDNLDETDELYNLTGDFF